MIIGSSSMSMAAASQRQVVQAQSLQGRVWNDAAGRSRTAPGAETVGRPATARPAAPRPPSQAAPPSSTAQPSQTAQPSSTVPSSQTAQPSSTVPPSSALQAEPAGDDQAVAADDAMRIRFGIMIALIESFTGRKIQVIDPSEVTNGAPTPQPVQDLPGGQRRGWGIDVTATSVRTEAEAMAFSAAGSVTTADGREISFSIDLAMRRESVEVTQFRLRAGDALVDPLTLNLGGREVALTPSKIDFDLNSDGRAERISFVANGSGFLALDRNGNGAIDNGTELFGPRTGNGFGELSAYDDDGNGWIDEGDAVYSKLRVWDSGGLTPLSEWGVGAIALDRVATPFTLRAGDGLTGVIRETGVWLGEDGSAGTIHNIDLAA